ncbi:isocitrate/isopropylmalate family dehydrogenase [Legionella maioricensis]|uniref:Isocitrate/isopropylmalate dehydrogenase family protein n=1 Tax=Legionella maioricensis TaxID=2896528 RepID=A0A9X2D299_9GAMM|nr:isocitrate/isopropylmalate dehydrogenase family protein [Legionella maioricensis]MCL9688426.1 isocitrate/isopropylmalate family dehydrogenase [Legionella maioricensis]
MKPKDKLKIAVLPGDGIGIEVTYAAIPIIEALNIPFQLTFGDIGWSYWQSEGNAFPDRTWQLIAESNSVLLGAVTSKPLREAKKELATKFQKKNPTYISPIIQLRQKLDLFANVRPCFSLKNGEKKFNFCIIRENTEGLYSGFDYYPLPEPIQGLLVNNQRWQSIPADEISCALRLQSQTGLSRLFEFAFQHANANGVTRVTFADKPNVLRQSSEFAREIFEKVSSLYPHINADILNVDAVGLWMIRRPEEFGVIVTENMFGDILSDVGAGIMGGLGFAPSANIGLKGSYFEPVHGSGLRMKNNSANPSAMFLSISMLLDHFGYQKQAKKIIHAVAAVVNKNRFVTYDLGGNATTAEMANAIIEQCLNSNQDLDMASFSIKKDGLNMIEQLQKLRSFSSAEISDALDSCGVEGALLDIKPLLQGMKLIGPAYTVQYKPNEEKTSTFKNAANYIDSIPAKSVIVIDNNGRSDCTVWGDILTQVALQKDIAGTVVYGAVRDVDAIRTTKYPVFSTAVYMRSGKNRTHKTNEQCPLIINKVTIYPGDIIFADDNGVLVIPQHLVLEIINKADAIKLTENNIKAAIKSGSTLEQARTDYRYDQPWLGAEKK